MYLSVAVVAAAVSISYCYWNDFIENIFVNKLLIAVTENFSASLKLFPKWLIKNMNWLINHTYIDNFLSSSCFYAV